MKCIFFISMIATLTGCQTAFELKNASTRGVANSYSCDQINAAFTAYEADKTSFVALKQIATMSGLVIEKSAEVNARSYYENVKATANVALLVQGCPPRA